MQLAQKTLRLAILASLATASTFSAQAAVITLGPVSFSNSANVTDSETPVGATANIDVSLGSTDFSKFDSSQGVLTGVEIKLSESTRNSAVTVASTDGPNNGNNNSRTTTGEGSSTAKIEAPGVSASFDAVFGSGSCSGNRLEACGPTVSTSTSTLPNTVLVVPAASLNSYIGSGTFTASRTAPTLTASQLGTQFTGTETTKYSITWEGKLNTEYAYLEHAAPSFDGSSTMLMLDLDFGTFVVGDSAELGFSIFNLAGDRVGLDLDTLTLLSGDSTAFDTGLAPFSALAAGGSNTFSARMFTSAPGAFGASYLLNFSDADVGAADSRFNYQLTLNLHGLVNPAEVRNPNRPTNGAPEPGTLALLGLGLAGLAAARRRKQ